QFEIFVYSPRTEAVHLRGGRVARGGLRWSDRREDFRTEVLGLMKAQRVKNAVIVPVGAKGGFILKRPPKTTDRGVLREEAVACYRTMMGGLLDITDNRVGGGIVHPERVLRYDGDDPYLVVAADKGTADFSDIANAVSESYGFWLGDAFASGGSAGYDHKGMGITARGAWESVRRMFLELGKDIQREPFTVVGIGDMSGDVFGNGMLLSEQIKLVAAFDHRHVFIDPDPDPAASFAERRRLFGLPRSSWADYDPGRLSAGGGVYPRTAKSIRLSPEARAALGVGEVEEFTPNELIRAVLRAPVDLFWNGGIGTYVKAAAERHAEAADRANDPVRIDAEELRCRVVGEGGNLGFTQRARIAFARRGGKINTDFIDNSAGVDCSDHEVNIKILLNAVERAGDMTRKQRDELLAAMTDEVGELVLRDNVLQVLAISMAEAEAPRLLDAQAAQLRRLEATGRLNRELELLPSEEVLAERRQEGHGLTRPEIAVLLAYAKMDLYDELLTSDVTLDPYLANDLVKYFPRPLRKRFRDEILEHRLRREIVATQLANGIVNRTLGAVVDELREETGCGAPEIARAYAVARDAFELVPLWGRIEALADRLSADAQIVLFNEVRHELERGVRWFLGQLPQPIAIAPTVARFGPGVAVLMEQLDAVLAPEVREAFEGRLRAYVGRGLDDALARRLAGLPYLVPACEVVAVAGQTGVEVIEAARVYFALDAALNLDRLRGLLGRAEQRSRWDRLALAALQDDVFRAERRLAVQALADSAAVAAAAGDIDRWLADHGRGVERSRRLLAELESAPAPDVAMISVAVRSLDGVSAALDRPAA
ncbi:MAG TPA: NAD-glutamate dehydrogenase domain-containing protein, partial [Geminicoccaceae bacterium]|nr:NAD-glutamate dehydrogenase domain-containing protein [Geminicoccaceae bacterium]